MLKNLLCASAVAVLFVGVSFAEEISLEGIKCPVSGKPAVEAGVADHNGGKVYFCCPNCPKAFAANTVKFAAKANLQLVQTGQAKQFQCPLKEKPVKETLSVTVESVEVGLCCPGCKKKASSLEGDALVNLFFSDAVFKKGFKVGEGDN